MKKYITLLIALAMTSSYAFAQDGERPDRPRRPSLEDQIEKIGGLLDGGELSERRSAYLAQRLEILTIQSAFRDAVKAEITEDMSREERHEAIMDVREAFADQMEALKSSRRAFFEGRRALRESGGG